MKYIDHTHTYLDGSEEYISTTKLIKRYEPYKDWDEIARKYAEKNKLSLADVKASWKAESQKGMNRGLAYHASQEEALVAEVTVEVEGKRYPVVPTPMEDGIKIAIPLKLEEGIYPELIIYSNKYKVAGQADRVDIHNGKITIKDYKTSKRIDLESYKHWRTGHEMMKPPVSHLMNCNFTTYSLQLNIYMFMIKSHNPKLKVGPMSIDHVKEDGVDVYEVPNLQKEAKKILEHYANQDF